MTKYIKTICLLITFFILRSYAVASDLPSVIEDKNDSLVLKRYFEISDLLIKKNFNDSALYYNTLCEEMLVKNPIPVYQHQCYHYYVRIYHAKADFNTALEYCLKSLEVARKNQNVFQEAASYRAIFNIYHNLYLNDSALKYAVIAQKLTEEIGDTANISINYGNLCWMYQDLEKYPEAIYYGKLGVETGSLYKDTVGWLVSLNNLALCYLQTFQYDNAIDLLKKQYELGYKYNRPRSIRNALYNLGTIYYYKGNIHELENTINQLVSYNIENPDIDLKNKCNQYLLKGFLYLFQRKFEACEAELLKSLEIAEADSVIDCMLTTYLTLSKLNYAKGDFIEGNYWEDKWDQLNRNRNEQHLLEFELELQTKYELKEKQVTIKLQEAKIRGKSNHFKLSILAIVGLIIISLLVLRTFQQRDRLQKQRINELIIEKQLEATEAVLKGEEQERLRLAKDLHDGLGGILSGLKHSFASMKGNLIITPDNHEAFERSMDMLDSSIKEMRRVAHNMMPETLVRFGLDTALKDFCNDISQSGALKVNYQSIGMVGISIDQTTSISIYRIVQELLNNTMKHAKATSAIVQLNKTNNLLTVTVEDNGNGFDTGILDAKKGIGWINIRNRIDFLKGTLDITSKAGEGTSVQIEFNV